MLWQHSSSFEKGVIALLKKWLSIVFMSMIFLTACNIQSVEQFEKQEKESQSIDSTKVLEEQQDTEEVEENKPAINEVIKEQEETIPIGDVETEVKEAEQKEEKSNSPPVDTKSQTLEKSNPMQVETSKETAVKESVVPKTEVNTPVKNTEAVQQTKPTTPIIQEEPKKYVTISIRVDTLLNNEELLDSSLNSTQFVPANGTVLPTVKYELNDNESVFDVLVRATREHKIHMEYQGANENNFGTVYIEGINHLYEFSAGPLSGWMFSVNGAYPNYGASKVILEDGDHVEWNYTVDLGRDLGVVGSE